MDRRPLGEVVEAIPFASGHVLFRNDTGAVSFCGDGSWRTQSYQVGVDDRIYVEPECPGVTSGAVASADLLVWFGGGPVRIRCFDDMYARWLRAVFTCVREFDSRDVAGEAAIYAACDGWWVSASGFRDEYFDSLAAAHWHLIRTLWRVCHPGDDWLALLHASAVAIGEQPIILAGTSGAGKSSLAAHLVSQGAPHLCDDIVPIDATRMALWSVPTRASVKDGSWAAMKKTWQSISVGDPHVFEREGVRYVEIRRLPGCAASFEKKPIVIFPLFEPQAATRCVAIDAVELLAGLGNTGTIYPDATGLLRRFLQWAENVDSFVINYSSATEASNEINGIVRGLS